VAPTPRSLLYPELGEAVERYLDHLLETQEEDGTWTPPWSWADAYPAAWAEAEQEWRGVLLVRHLESLAAHGRLP